MDDDLREEGGPGSPEKKGQSQDEEGAGKASEQEIFERRLAGLFVSSLQSRQRIAGDGKDFKAQENHQQVRRRRHDHQAGEGQQQEGEDLSVVGILLSDILQAQQDDKSDSQA